MNNELTPKETVKAYCRTCLGLKQWEAEAVRNCQGDQAMCGSCFLFPYRLGRRISVKVFRKVCLQCMGGNRQSVKECPAPTCPAYPYRFGTNPARKAAGGNFFQNAREPIKKEQISIFPSDEGQYRGGDISTQKNRKKGRSRSCSPASMWKLAGAI